MLVKEHELVLKLFSSTVEEDQEFGIQFRAQAEGGDIYSIWEQFPEEETAAVGQEGLKLYLLNQPSSTTIAIPLMVLTVWSKRISSWSFSNSNFTELGSGNVSEDGSSCVPPHWSMAGWTIPQGLGKERRECWRYATSMFVLLFFPMWWLCISHGNSQVMSHKLWLMSV